MKEGYKESFQRNCESEKENQNSNYDKNSKIQSLNQIDKYDSKNHHQSTEIPTYLHLESFRCPVGDNLFQHQKLISIKFESKLN